MKGRGTNRSFCRALRYGGHVGFTKLDSAEIPRSKKASAAMGTR